MEKEREGERGSSGKKAKGKSVVDALIEAEELQKTRRNKKLETIRGKRNHIDMMEAVGEERGVD